MTDEQRAHIERALSTLVNLQPIIANGLLDRRQLAFIDPHHEIAMEALEAVLIAERVEPVEPYCYVYEYDGVFGLHREFYPLPYNGMKPSRTVPVYTTPPRQKPLTDDEIPALAEKAWKPSIYYDAEALLGTDGLVALVRAVEAKHNIKE